MLTIHSSFSSRLITSHFFAILIVFRRFFTCIALGDVDLRFSLTFLPKVNDDERGITRAASLYHQRNQALHQNDGVQ